MRIPVSQVNAFTARPFRGNPAAVCVLQPTMPVPDTQLRQAIAAEMNLSETAFVEWRPDGPLGLRWFTPEVEVDLCGHATLASAYTLWHEGYLPWDQPIEFQTRSGILTCVGMETREGQPQIQLDFPALPWEVQDAPAGLADALGVIPLKVVRSSMDLLVQIDSEQEVKDCRPDFAALAQLPIRGLILTAASQQEDLDFISRFFAPGVGIPEDPVTGSAHCLLGPFWQQQMGKDSFSAFQASKRGGHIDLTVAGNRVLLRGQAERVWKGELELPGV